MSLLFQRTVRPLATYGHWNGEETVRALYKSFPLTELVKPASLIGLTRAVGMCKQDRSTTSVSTQERPAYRATKAGDQSETVRGNAVSVARIAQLAADPSVVGERLELTMPPKPIIEFDDIPREVIAGPEEIRKVNPHRFEMEHLNGVTLYDDERQLVAGFKDVRDNEFWVRGHMPGSPLLPGVLMCEAAAQLGSFYVSTGGFIPEGYFLGLAHLDEARFRGVVRPGDRLWIVGQATDRVLRRMYLNFQGFVEGKMVFEVRMKGLAIRFDQVATAGE